MTSPALATHTASPMSATLRVRRQVRRSSRQYARTILTGTCSTVTMSWKKHVPNPDQVSLSWDSFPPDSLLSHALRAQIPGCDFRALNRAAVIEGNFTAKTQVCVSQQRLS